MITDEIRERYFQLLTRYVAVPSEQPLLEAADLGREFACDLPPEDITELHEISLVRFAREHSRPDLTLAATTSVLLMEVQMAHSLEFRRQVEARKSAEQELQKVNDALRCRVQELEIYKKVFQALPLGISVFSLDQDFDPSSLTLRLGNPAAELTCARIAPNNGGALPTLQGAADFGDRSLAEACADVARQGISRDFGVSAFSDEHGETVYVHTYAFPLADRHVGLHMSDITERRSLEAQLRHSQKMEAVGRLAGGVAHDFNNLLTVIFNAAEFAAANLPPGSLEHQDIQQVLQAAESAAGITRQLLVFSHKKAPSSQVLEPEAQIRNIEGMLQHLLRGDIKYSARFPSRPWNIRIDPSGFEQVIVNLAINARDAMPQGGEFDLDVINLTIQKGQGQPALGIEPGEYVELSVTDNGVGMSEEVRHRVLEPFFSTKGPSQGTGLGLSTCVGIIEQIGGTIHIKSRLGDGTTVRVLIPRAEGKIETRSPFQSLVKAQGQESILLAEDDENVRQLSSRALRERGYMVVTVSTAAEALQRCREHQFSFDLLVTDIIMPGESGVELALRVKEEKPEMKVLFISGYLGDALAKSDDLPSDAPLLEKPFHGEMLLRTVRDLLDS